MGILETEKVQIYLPVSKQPIGQNEIEDSTSSNSRFRRIPAGRMVEHRIANNILDSSKLKSLAERAGFDALEKDLMFHKTASYEFEAYKMIRAYEDKESYEELFPEENLRYFWSSARAFLESRNESSNKRVN